MLEPYRAYYSDQVAKSLLNNGTRTSPATATPSFSSSSSSSSKQVREKKNKQKIEHNAKNRHAFSDVLTATDTLKTPQSSPSPPLLLSKRKKAIGLTKKTKAHYLYKSTRSAKESLTSSNSNSSYSSSHLYSLPDPQHIRRHNHHHHQRSQQYFSSHKKNSNSSAVLPAHRISDRTSINPLGLSYEYLDSQRHKTVPFDKDILDTFCFHWPAMHCYLLVRILPHSIAILPIRTRLAFLYFCHAPRPRQPSLTDLHQQQQHTRPVQSMFQSWKHTLAFNDTSSSSSSSSIASTNDNVENNRAVRVGHNIDNDEDDHNVVDHHGIQIQTNENSGMNDDAGIQRQQQHYAYLDSEHSPSSNTTHAQHKQGPFKQNHADKSIPAVDHDLGAKNVKSASREKKRHRPLSKVIISKGNESRNTGDDSSNDTKSNSNIPNTHKRNNGNNNNITGNDERAVTLTDVLMDHRPKDICWIHAPCSLVEQQSLSPVSKADGDGDLTCNKGNNFIVLQSKRTTLELKARCHSEKKAFTNLFKLNQATYSHPSSSKSGNQVTRNVDFIQVLRKHNSNLQLKLDKLIEEVNHRRSDILQHQKQCEKLEDQLDNTLTLLQYHKEQHTDYDEMTEITTTTRHELTSHMDSFKKAHQRVMSRHSGKDASFSWIMENSFQHLNHFQDMHSSNNGYLQYWMALPAGIITVLLAILLGLYYYF